MIELFNLCKNMINLSLPLVSKLLVVGSPFFMIISGYYLANSKRLNNF